MTAKKYQYVSLNEQEKIDWLKKYRAISFENCDELLIKQFLRAESFKAIIDYTTAYVGTAYHLSKHNVSILDIKDLFYADRELRNILLAAIDVVETHLKTLCTEVLCSMADGDMFFYKTSPQKFFKNGLCPEAVTRACTLALTSKDSYLTWFKENFEGDSLTFWGLASVLPFGDFINFCFHLNDVYLFEIASYYRKTPKDLMRQLSKFKELRNLCAHQQRIWKQDITQPAAVLIEELKDFIDKEPYKKINEDFMARWLTRIAYFKEGNKAFINEGYGF